MRRKHTYTRSRWHTNIYIIQMNLPHLSCIGLQGSTQDYCFHSLSKLALCHAVGLTDILSESKSNNTPWCQLRVDLLCWSQTPCSNERTILALFQGVQLRSFEECMCHKKSQSCHLGMKAVVQRGQCACRWRRREQCFSCTSYKKMLRR